MVNLFFMQFIKKLSNIFNNAPPDLRKRLVSIIAILAVCNGLLFLYTLLVWYRFPVMLGLVLLAFGLGLRHAVDADHIAAIDNTTRKLMQDGQKPVAVGFFFSLGHSTIVVILSIIVAVSVTFVKKNLPTLQNIGIIIGTSVSSLFLLAIGIINLFVLIEIIKTWKFVTKNQRMYSEKQLQKHLQNRGFLNRLFQPLLKAISASWHMYFVGFLFGLGFDTASEVGLLSISAASGASGMPVGNILLLPLAFTAGMSLIDTLDGILMLGAYGWAYIKPIRKLYYNMNITFISVMIALFIGTIEALQAISAQLKLTGNFFNTVNNFSFGTMGYIIIGILLVSWIISIVMYQYKGYDEVELK